MEPTSVTYSTIERDGDHYHTLTWRAAQPPNTTSTIPLMIDLSLWYPHGVTKTRVLSPTQYYTPASGRELPNYVVPPKTWPGISCTDKFDTEMKTQAVPKANSPGHHMQPSQDPPLDRVARLRTTHWRDPAGYRDPHPTTTEESQVNPGHIAPNYNLNYKGDLTKTANQSADIPESENCSVFLTNLPPDCDYHALFGALRNIGKVSHSNITPPNGTYSTCSAKIEFFDRASVDRLVAQIKQGHLCIGYSVPEVRMNRIRVRARDASVTSRVLIVEGPSSIVTRAVLEELFAGEGLKYGLESVITLLRTPKRRCLEYRFASLRAQSTRAKGIIENQRRNPVLSEDQKALWDDVFLTWGRDPCE